jgi:hypothetical protein
MLAPTNAALARERTAMSSEATSKPNTLGQKTEEPATSPSKANSAPAPAKADTKTQAVNDVSTGQLQAEPNQIGSFYGFANDACCRDQDTNLRQKCGDFTRVTVPLTRENYPADFGSLCKHLGKKCLRVCDWEGKTKDCEEISQTRGDHPIRDGSRVAYCSAQ